MIVVNLSGGIGNQLFQYALAMYLKEKFQKEIFFCTNSFKYNADRTPEINLLCPECPEFRDAILFSSYRKTKYRLKKMLFILNPSNKLITDGNINFSSIHKDGIFYYFFGYWQTDRFVSTLDIDSYFSPKSPRPKIIEFYQNQIERVNAISIHIRRGDYFSAQYIKQYGVCTVNYYKNAIKYVCEKVQNPIFFIFSDDIEWVKENLNLPLTTTYIKNDNINNYWYIYLMSKCNHNIISNSSFSWWGAYLNKNSDKIIVSPDKWLVNSSKTIALKNWIKISTL